MIKFEEKVEAPKKQDENRLDQIKEATFEKRKMKETADPNSRHSTRKNKED